jgi:hypothetical protein
MHEGLASGCSLVAPPLAPFTEATRLGPFGTLAASGSSGLARALAAEADAWEEGRRSATAIAAFWRARLDMDRVAESSSVCCRTGPAILRPQRRALPDGLYLGGSASTRS